ncbi:dimethylarginine dimethylaminohydrolase family protein [Gryllotalpicola ginsengisoli]|uniref:dimethylarginine dimethylaminohydrolase family protein n=1 Tax=Gryllotalpicola ginsengisoli TaxID=444608 RepID=UPI0003B63482|nr:arginine deiminase family protein [Gryllotalpicola ginsengisoli]
MTTPWSRRLAASFFAALSTTLVAFAATVLALYLVNSLSLASIPTYTGDFALPALLLLVVLFIGGLLGAFSSWWGSLLAGLIAGIVASGVTGFILVKSEIVSILASVVGFYLFFIVAGTVAAALLGRSVYQHWVARPVARGRVAFVRVPSANLAEGIVTHRARTLLDPALADKQWDDYVAALSSAGWQTVEVAPADDLADAVFVEDAAVILSSSVGVITRPGAEGRRAETASVADKLREQGLTLYEIEAPGTLDGGDVLVVGDTVYVGRSARTDADGIRQLREVVTLAGLDLTVVAVPVTGALHLKTVATALPDGTVLVAGDQVDASVFARALRVPEPSGANLVVLDPSTVLMPASAPQTVALVEDLGYRVVVVDVSEFEKVEGSVTCLSVRL